MDFKLRRSRLTALLLVLLLAPTSALASPWVAKDGTTVLSVSAGADFATSEFLPDGKHQGFPLDGNFNSYYLEVSGRRGFPLGFEVNLKATLKGVSYRADPVLLVLDEKNPPSTLQEHRDAVIDFNEQAFGLADIQLGVAHQHLLALLRIASHLILKVPAGYDKPSSTFRDDTPSAANVQDDVALGDGQVDLEYSLRLGYMVPPTKTLLELDAGYRVRFGGPGHQFAGLFKLGQFITKYVLVYAGVEAAVTLFDGDELGKTFVAKDPEVPARLFQVGNIEAIPMTLDRDYLMIRAGVIVRVLKREWVLNFSHVAWGQNVARTTGFSLGVILPFT